MASPSPSSSSKRREEPTGSDDEWEVSFPELLRFAARAQALIAELLAVSDEVPPEFRDRQFDPVLFDLRYFDSPDEFEARIDGNGDLEQLEDELRESCSTFLQRFFRLANGIVTYHQELLRYLNDHQEGVFLQSKLDKVLENECGRQLLAESLSLFGCLLLLMEHQMNGYLREKLLVAHLRQDHHFDAPNLEKICLLCRTNPSSPGQPRQVHLPRSSSSMISVQKPEEIFARFPFPKMVVDAIICRVRDDDLYNRAHHYPDPQHRTVALSSQAGCLYLLLLFSPEFLHNGLVMREIVDRFFKDCWVVPIFLYFTVDLSISWDAFREAKTSLYSYLSLTFIRDRTQLNCTKVKELLSELDSVLSDGILTREYVFENSQHLLALVRTCNISARWLLLHKSSIDKKLRDVVASAIVAHQVEDEILFMLLLKTSQLEFEVKQLFVELLQGKEAMWHESKRHASDCMKEISHIYSGSWASLYKIKNESPRDWFGKLSIEVHSLDYTRTGISGRKLYHVISALKEFEQFHQVEENLQINQHLTGVQQYLQDMLKALNFDNDTMSTFAVITDAVYAWGFIARFTELLNKEIERDPSVVLNLHSFLLKFQLLLEVPVSRIAQSRSSDLVIPNYYSSQYVSHVRAMLGIIPVMVFRVFNEDALQTIQPFHLPNRIEKVNLQDFMQLEQQLNLIKAVNMTSIFSQGMLLMSRNFLGLIDLDMKKWLESQVRKELSKRIEYKLKSIFLSPSVGPEELEMSMRSLTTYILSQMHMMECFQDLLHIHGNCVWEEVLTNILKHCTQEEHDCFVRRRQGSTVTHLHLNDLSKAQTFLGRLLCQILHLISPSRSMFIEPMSGWFDAEGHELLGLHFFDLLESCVGAVGMTSLDSVLTFVIEDNLENILAGLKNMLDVRCLEELHKLDTSLGPAASMPLMGSSPYKQMLEIANTSWEPWIESLAFIGQLQLLRRMIFFKLKSACKVTANVISFAAEGMIGSVSLEGVKEVKEDGTAEMFLQDLNKQGMLCGFCSPFQTIFISKDPPPFLGRCAAIVTISQLSRYVLDPHLGTLTCRLKKVILDFSPLVIGLGTFLRQFHPTYMTQYVQYMGQYVRTMAETAFGAQYEAQKKTSDMTSEVTKSAFWLMNFCKHMEIPKDLLDSCLPPSLFTVLQA